MDLDHVYQYRRAYGLACSQASRLIIAEMELTSRVLYFAGGEAELPAIPEPKKIKRKVETTSESIKEKAEGARRRTKKVVE
jgi:hypothetical protein